MNHKLWKDGDVDIPKNILDRNGAVAIACCKYCGLAEIELDQHRECKPSHIPKFLYANKEMPITGASILREAANTYDERNKLYKDNFNNVAMVMTALFPDGISLTSSEDFKRWHNFELIIVKLTRFANSGLTHKDSIRDAEVYAAIVESFIHKNTTPIKEANK